MEIPALIYLKNQKSDKDSFMINNGTVSLLAGGVYFKYGEDEESTCIGVSNDTVTINKMGEMTYTMVLETNKESLFNIVTERGNIPVRLIPTLVNTDIADGNIEVELKYTLIFGEAHSQENGMYLKCVYAKSGG